MNESKNNKENGKKPVKCTPVDWDSYKIKKEEAHHSGNRKAKQEWEQPVVGEKWAIDKQAGDKPAYDFAADEEFNKALKEADKKEAKAKKTAPEKEPKAEAKADSREEKKPENKTEKGTVKKSETKRKKSLNKKLDELGSNWVSTGNFRNGDNIDDKAFKSLETNIIATTKKDTSDDFLSRAVSEVNEALRDKDGYEPLGEVSLADTFEIPKLDIHFGDTEDLKEAKNELKEIKDEDLKKQVEQLDLAASIEAQTKKELEELKEAEEVDKIIVKSDELKKKKKKRKPAAAKEEKPVEEAPENEIKPARKKKKKKTPEAEKAGIKEADKITDIENPEEDTVPVRGKKPATTGKKKKTSRKDTDRTPMREEAEDRPVRKKKSQSTTQKTGTGKTGKTEQARKRPVKKEGLVKKEGSAKEGAFKGILKKEEPVKAPAAKSGPSEFRKKSADWKDKKTIDATAKTVSFEEKKKQLAERIKKVTPLQWSIAAMALIIFVTGIMTTVAYANYQGEENKALALASLSQYKEDESYAAVATKVTEEMIPEAAEEPETVKEKVLSLEMTSVEKDLKIKLVDEDDTLVKDVSWSVTVSEDKGDDSVSDGEVYEDDDMDGTIYIENIAAGEYSVVLNPSDSLADYIIPQDKQMVAVKATIEYKVIANIKDEIKSEKEVNVALEDPNGNQAADVETEGPANTDTVEWCESTREASGEEFVEATPDLSKTAASAKKKTGFLTALLNLSKGTRTTALKKLSLGFYSPLGYLVADNEDLAAPADESDEDKEPTPTPTPTPVPEDQLTEVTPTPTPTPTPSPDQLTDETSITISGTGTVIVGGNITVTAVVKPDNSTVAWNISDSTVASISDNGSTCQVTGVKAGEVTIYATCSNGKETSMKITVTDKEPQYSDDAKLYDASKNALYVKDGDEYRLATYGDYKSGNYSTYYRKQEAFLYTGWQEIDGHTYYYKSDHTYVTGEQIIQGIRYNFASDGTLSKGSGTLGIDVSKYQPSINWAAVKASGVNYVIIRCGYRGASTGSLIQDPYFTSHIKGAKAAGLKVGVYFFTTALNETEAVEEASMCAALCSGYGINYPVFMDCESSSRPGYNELSASERTAIIKAFCNTIKSAGYTPGVYANKTWLSSKMNASSLSGAKIWLAQYNAAGPTYSGRYDLWQYTSKGHVDGISGNVDMNQSYLGY